MFASTSSSFPLALVGNIKVIVATTATIANMNALRFIVVSLLSLLIDNITDLAGTLFNSFDARNLYRVSILPLQLISYRLFEVAGIKLPNLAASHDYRCRTPTVKGTARGKHNKCQNQHAHYVVLPGPAIIGPKQNLLQRA